MRPPTLRLGIVTGILVVLVSGCEDAVISTGALVRDSAGVTIVENTEPVWANGDGWRLTERWQVDIGVLEGDARYELFDVKSAIRLPDGRIAVGDNGAAELRYYDSTGTHLTTAGSRGGGPGEFQRVTWMARGPGDSLIVHDIRQRRITLMDAAARFGRSMSLATQDITFYPSFVGVDSDGSLIGVWTHRRRGEDLPFGFDRDSIMIFRLDRDGRMQDTLGWFPHQIVEVQMRSIADHRMRLPATLPFTPRTVATAAGDRLFVGTSDAYEIRTFDRDGTLQTVIRRAHTPVPVTPADRQYVVDSLRERFAGRLDNPEVEYMIRTTAESPLPDAFPAFDSLLVDADGNLWVRQYNPPGHRETRWSVFDRQGLFLGEIDGPDNFQATDIGSDYVLGVGRGEFDVMHVRMYGIIKGRSAKQPLAEQGDQD